MLGGRDLHGGLDDGVGARFGGGVGGVFEELGSDWKDVS